MRKVNTRIQDIISQIQSLKGQPIDVEVNRGRKKTIKVSGIVESVYPSIFTIRSNDLEKNSFSYSYADVLCGDVKFQLNNKNSEQDDKQALV